MFLLYYRPYCPYSINSDKLMKQLSLPHKTIKINRDNDVIKDQLKLHFEHNTFPAIIYYDDIKKMNDLSENVPSNGIFIGGNNDFVELLDNVKKLSKDNIKKTYNSLNNKNNVTYRDYLLVSNYILKNT